MKAGESSLFNFLEGSNQFIIPIYQRTYSWSRPQCEQLWNDIIKTGLDEDIPGHFIGSIVYITKGVIQAGFVNQFLVIDGQQRLTTLSLILHALAKAFEERDGENDKTGKKLINNYLINLGEENIEKFKLLLTQTDKDTYFAIIEDRDIPNEYSPRIVENYEYFKDNIKKSKHELEQILNGIMKLFIVDVSLDRNYDNPQLIFESLNSTGLDLSQADLIRNYILMGQEHKVQEELYKKYWYPMEQSYGYEYNSNFDRFMRDYLTIKTGSIPVMRNVYREFKKYISVNGNSDMSEIVKDIKYYSDLYVKMIFAQHTDNAINEAFKDIKELKVEVAYPFLLQVFSDFTEGKIAQGDFIEILRSVESYVFRRVVVGIPTNSLNKTFANLYKEIDQGNYLESYHAVMNLKDSYRRFPNDEEFKKQFIIKDFYNFRSRNYLLRKLENYDRKEKVKVEEYTIEHILPQNKSLSKDWREMLGEDWEQLQKKYLHTIGNLTLTGYNPELSDKPFPTKRNMEGGFKDSPIRLNKSLAGKEKWDETEILERANILADKASDIWSFKDLPEGVLEKYVHKNRPKNGNYTIDNFSNVLKGDLLDLFNILRIRIKNIDSSVNEEFKKLYIAYKNTTNFVDIIPRQSGLRLALNMDYDEINDPENRCKDVTGKGMWGNGNVRLRLSNTDGIDYAMYLIQQAYDKHAEHPDA